MKFMNNVKKSIEIISRANTFLRRVFKSSTKLPVWCEAYGSTNGEGSHTVPVLYLGTQSRPHLVKLTASDSVSYKGTF